jgi:hypothetical protein
MNVALVKLGEGTESKQLDEHGLLSSWVYFFSRVTLLPAAGYQISPQVLQWPLHTLLL